MRGDDLVGALDLVALDLEPDGRRPQKLVDGALPNDPAPVDDRHGVAGPLDLVEQVRGEHDGPPLAHEIENHLAHLAHARRIETVHRLVEHEKIGIPEQASSDSEPLAHSHRVTRYPVVGPFGQTDPFEGRSDAAPGLGLASRCDDSQVLATGQVPVEPRLVDDRSDARQSGGPLFGHRKAEKRHGARVGASQSRAAGG